MRERYEVKPLPFAYTALDGISEQQLKYHHDVHYAAYVRNRNKIEDQLAEMRRKGDFPNIRGLKLSESHNASGMILHLEEGIHCRRQQRKRLGFDVLRS